MLNIRRNHLAADLVRQSKEKYHGYIKERCCMEIELPPVRDRFQEELDNLFAEHQRQVDNGAE